MFDLISVGDLQAPVHSLLASVEAESNGDGKWENGVTFTNHGCYIVGGYCLFCDDSPSDSFTDQDCTDAAQFKPFELDLGTSWTPADNFDIQALAEDDLKVGTSSKLEDLMWNGCAGGTNPTLASSESLGAAAAPVRALGKMMAAFIDSTDHVGAKGTIYMSPVIAVELFDRMTEKDGSLYTLVGQHKVIIGDFPSTHIAGHLGDPVLFVGEIRTTDAPDEVRRANLRTVRVQRSALVAWNTCAAFIQQVTLP